MEILSDATFRGNVSISGGAFSVTPKGESSPLLKTNDDGLTIDGSEWVRDDLVVYGQLSVYNSLNLNSGAKLKFDNDSKFITGWSDLNNILNFAPKSLSTAVSSLCTTVSSHTTKINSACSTISSLCTKVNSLCNTVSNIGLGRKYAFGNPTLPAGCTKFYFVDNYNNGRRELYKFLKGDNIYNPSTAKVLKGGFDGPNEEVQMDIKQYFCSFGSTARWFEATLASNTSGVVETEFILLFDEFQEMCTTEKVPQ